MGIPYVYSRLRGIKTGKALLSHGRDESTKGCEYETRRGFTDTSPLQVETGTFRVMGTRSIAVIGMFQVQANVAL